MGFASACMQFEVNTLGPLRTVTALSASLSPGAKVALIGSKMGSIAATRQGGKSGSAGYRCVRGVGEEHAGVRVRCSQVVVVGVGGKEANEERFPGFLLACACACTEGWGGMSGGASMACMSSRWSVPLGCRCQVGWAPSDVDSYAKRRS
jgi:hypothetical protein